MKLSSDIQALIQNDVEKLSEAFCTGRILVGGNDLTTTFDQNLLHSLATDIISYQIKNKMPALVLPYLASMKWLTLSEARIYARKSRNTILKLVKEMKIYGTKAEGGDYIVDRESIDAYYNCEKDDLRDKLSSLKRLWS